MVKAAPRAQRRDEEVGTPRGGLTDGRMDSPLGGQERREEE